MLNNFIPKQNSYPTQTQSTSNFTISIANKVDFNSKANTLPELNSSYPIYSKQNRLYNIVPLKTVYGESVIWNGNYVAITNMQPLSAVLTTTEMVTHYTNRKLESKLSYLYSTDGLNWEYGGDFYVYNDSDMTSLSNVEYQWSGYMVMREGSTNTFDLFYSYVNMTLDKSMETATYPNGPISSANYSIMHMSGTLNSDMSISITSNPKSIMAPDDLTFSSWWMNKNVIYQDPYIFVNPYDGYVYGLISGSVALGDGTLQMKDLFRGVMEPGYVEKNTANKTAIIGLTRFSGDTFDTGTWVNLSPILSLCGVSSEAMNPTLIFKDDYTYLFFSLSSDTSNVPTGLYCFYSENGIFGDFYPANGDGKVLTNPSTDDDQIFNFTVDMNLDVYSIIKKSYTFTPAPTTKIIVDKENVYIGTQSNYGLIRPKRDWKDIYTNSNPYTL